MLASVVDGSVKAAVLDQQVNMGSKSCVPTKPSSCNWDCRLTQVDVYNA